MTNKTKKLFEELVDIIHVLRAPGGCPWDRKQTNLSLLPKMQEEVAEVAEALVEDDFDHLPEELGDVLLNVLMQVEIADEAKKFTLDDVMKTLVDKLIRRHPHVFGDEELTTPEEVLARWQEIKKQEK